MYLLIKVLINLFLSFDDHYRAAEAICGMHGENLDGNVLKVLCMCDNLIKITVK